MNAPITNVMIHADVRRQASSTSSRNAKPKNVSLALGVTFRSQMSSPPESR